MIKNNFLLLTDVQDFISWLVINLPKLHICLKIRKSRFVPKGVNANVTGINGVLNHYMWRSTGMTTGDWGDTKTRLTVLSNKLRAAVGAGNHTNVLTVCDDILTWGGNRSRKVGAYPFLHAMAPGTLSTYIGNTGAVLSLASADDASLSPPIKLMNAMLTKVHALYASDGLPIYDSRVAAAIASLVELWRQSTGKSGCALPSALTFPATLSTRTVLRLFPNAHHPGVMTYGAPTTPQHWSSAKVRLGWILEEVLNQSPELLFSSLNVGLTDRMHAFEASLFMIGYDTACLNCINSGATTTDKSESTNATPTYASAIKKIRKKLLAKFEKMDRYDCVTLKHKKPFEYSGNLDEGFVIWYEKSEPVLLEPEFIQEIQNTFGGECKIPFGFTVTDGDAPVDSFGVWITEQSPQFGRKLTGKHASRIAALLVHVGLATSISNTIQFN